MGGVVYLFICYVMNYIKLVCEYSDMLKQVYVERDNLEVLERFVLLLDKRDDRFSRDECLMLVSLIGCLVWVFQNNLDGKVKMYKDFVLMYLFFMNNIYYVV